MTPDATPCSRKTELSVKAAILFVAFVVSVFFVLSPWGRHLELLCYDALFLLRGSRPAPGQVVVVAIDEPSFGVLERRWPWPRAWHARLIDTLFREGAGGVAVDLLFSEPGDPEDDEMLGRSVRTHPGTVLAAAVDVIDATRYRQQALISPSAAIAGDEARIGIINLPSDPDGFVRRGIANFGQMPSLFYAAFQVVSFGKQNVNSVLKPVPTGEVLANYFGPPQTLQTVSYYQAMDPERYLPANYFRGKLVFIGLSLQADPETGSYAADHFPYPFSRQGAHPISGVEIQATLGANLMNGDWIRTLPGHLGISVFFWAIAFSMLVFFPARKAYGFTGLLAGATAFSVYGLFSYRACYFPPLFAMLPVIGGLLSLPVCDAVRLRREKQKIRDMFSKYVSPKVVDRLVVDPGQLRLGGQRVDATVMQLDIEGFSRMAASMSPEDLVGLLSRCLGHFSETIFNMDGMVDKYVGDAIMAIWGAPLPQDDHAEKACRAALEIRRNLKVLLANEAEASKMSMDIRIGINSGEMLAGNVGGKRFLNYTVHGEAVNLAVRLEALNKVYGTRILIGHETALRLGKEFITREIDRIEMTGQSSPVTIYELMGLAAEGHET